MDWFERLTGFAEESAQQVHENLRVEGEWLISKVNNRRWYYGDFRSPLLHKLRYYQPKEELLPKLKVRELVADVQQLHANPENAGAIFQVASQFNMLEMASPSFTPEMGVGIYQDDLTQGPACAIAAGAGTIWRNYFMPLPGQTGQSETVQFDALHALGRELGNKNGQLWKMRNGYVLTSREALEHIHSTIKAASEEEYERLKGFLRIGWQSYTQVTLPKCDHLVHQLYCSALPVAYSKHPIELWEPFARLILEAAYEATFSIALQQLVNTKENKLYLTMLGGGAFGNRTEWIIDAIRPMLHKFAAAELDVVIVSHGKSNPAVKTLVDEVMQGFASIEAEEKAKREKWAAANKKEPLTQSEKRGLLKQLVDSWRIIEGDGNCTESLLICPTCEQRYQKDGLAEPVMSVLHRLAFVQMYKGTSYYEDEPFEDKLSMPICADCNVRILLQAPCVDESDDIDVMMNGYRVYRRAKFGGCLHWVLI